MTNFGYYVTNTKEVMEEAPEGLGTTGVVLYTAEDEADARRWATANGVLLGGNRTRGEEGRKAYEAALAAWKP